MDTKNRNKYIDAWKKENTMCFSVRFQNKCDADIVERINRAVLEGETKCGYIKRLIREDIARENNK